MKKLICAKEIEEFIKTGSKVFYINSNTILTPSAKDIAKNEGIEFKEECITSEEGCDTLKLQGNGIDSQLIYNALQVMAKQGKLEGFMEMFMKNKKYICEKDSNGFKLIKGDSVKLEELDTGNPADVGKVYYQELIGADDKSPMNAGFLTIEKTEFNWEVLVDEIYYIIEGTLQVSIGAKVYTANPGDSLFAPKGTNVKWGSPNKARVFYSTY